MTSIVLPILTSFVITMITIPSIIKLASIKQFYDIPSDIKSHHVKTPTLGGVAIFGSIVYTVVFWSSPWELAQLQHVIYAIMILFFVGVKDDLYKMVAWKKLLGQVVFAFILVHFAQIRITTFYGLFGINHLTTFPSYILSIFTIVVITNSFNLIDGIDYLAGAIGIQTSLCFGVWFYLMGLTQYSILAFSVIGSLLAFLYYNRTPARIFMGDTGSLIIGGILSLFALKFIEINRLMNKEELYKVLSVPVVTIAILIVPLFDTLRIFFIRVKERRSPFKGDRQHIHHLLLILGLTHAQTTVVLILFALLAVGFVYFGQGIKGEIMLLCLLGTCVIISSILTKTIRKKLN